MSRMSPREAIERDRLTSSDADTEYKSLWITDRILRLAEYQDVIERVNDQVAELRDADDSKNPYSEGAQASKWEAYELARKRPQRIPAMLLKMKIEALRTAAEELGQLPNDLPAATEKSVYAVIGISPDDLNRLRLPY